MFVYGISSSFIVVLVAACCQTRLKPDVQELILAAHNTVRRDVTPTASNMQSMSWDQSIASLAQRWAENCVWGHDANFKRTDNGRFSVGQNMAANSGDLDWNWAISDWAKEKNDYTYDGDNTGKVVGHYTQIVWAETSKVGCGYAKCGDRNHYVCNYGPAGNVGNQLPYAKGETCAECPDRRTNGLCDCGGLVCLNGGTLDLKECKCTCKQPFHIQPNCALNCEGAVDPSYCATFYAGKCEVYSNVPYDCPNMCKWCPYADLKFLK
ncbi:allurin-like [Dreissena polymorpha]|uniref:allurin-like n=1 Tax=Dreissena polymorpha TaxID=45954 RepID=UPI00226428F8|nr:allurin-like [Dreissena polymorpha]